MVWMPSEQVLRQTERHPVATDMILGGKHFITYPTAIIRAEPARTVPLRFKTLQSINSNFLYVMYCTVNGPWKYSDSKLCNDAPYVNTFKTIEISIICEFCFLFLHTFSLGKFWFCLQSVCIAYGVKLRLKPLVYTAACF